jgi:hypothetical protein
MRGFVRLSQEYRGAQNVDLPTVDARATSFGRRITFRIVPVLELLLESSSRSSFAAFSPISILR